MRMLIAVCWCFFIGKMMIIHFNHLKIYVIFRDDQTPIGCSCSSIYPYFSWWDLQVLIMISFQTCLLANPSLFIANLTHQPISFFQLGEYFPFPFGFVQKSGTSFKWTHPQPFQNQLLQVSHSLPNFQGKPSALGMSLINLGFMDRHPPKIHGHDRLAIHWEVSCGKSKLIATGQ